MTAPAHSESSIPVSAAVVKPEDSISSDVKLNNSKDLTEEVCACPADPESESPISLALLTAQQDKKTGNDHFKSQNYPKSLGAYHRVLMQLTSLTDGTEAGVSAETDRNKKVWQTVGRPIQLDERTGREIGVGGSSGSSGLGGEDGFSSMASSMAASAGNDSRTVTDEDKMREIAVLAAQTLVNMSMVYLRQVEMSSAAAVDALEPNSDSQNSDSPTTLPIDSLKKLSKSQSNCRKALALIQAYNLEGSDNINYSRSKPAFKLAQTQMLLGDDLDTVENSLKLCVEGGMSEKDAGLRGLRKEIAEIRKRHRKEAKGVFGKMFG